MKITLKLLEEKGACSSAIKEFKDLKLEGIEVHNLIKMIHEKKDPDNEYSWWLFEVLELTGKYIDYYSNGNICLECDFEKGRFEGKYIDYFSNGRVYSERNYKRSILHGKQISYYSNGQVCSEHNYKKGRYHGKQISYYSNGGVYSERNYTNGKEIKD